MQGQSTSTFGSPACNKKIRPPFVHITLTRLYQNQPHRLMKGCVCSGCTEVKSHATGEGQLTHKPLIVKCRLMSIRQVNNGGGAALSSAHAQKILAAHVWFLAASCLIGYFSCRLFSPPSLSSFSLFDLPIILQCGKGYFCGV